MIIATVPYINALPLTAFLTTNTVKIPPAQMIAQLLSGKVDVALVPVFSCLKHGLHMYPNAGIIGCDGTVKSVGFFTKPHITDLSQIKSIYLDRESQSSVYLARIILKKYYALDLDLIENHHFDNSDEADAQLLIGDKALFFKATQRLPSTQYWDLGEIWKQKTGSGFIIEQLPTGTVVYTAGHVCSSKKSELVKILFPFYDEKMDRKKLQKHLFDSLKSFAAN